LAIITSWKEVVSSLSPVPTSQSLTGRSWAKGRWAYDFSLAVVWSKWTRRSSSDPDHIWVWH
jgi:hypothetical protein